MQLCLVCTDSGQYGVEAFHGVVDPHMQFGIAAQAPHVRKACIELQPGLWVSTPATFGTKTLCATPVVVHTVLWLVL